MHVQVILFCDRLCIVEGRFIGYLHCIIRQLSLHEAFWGIRILLTISIPMKLHRLYENSIRQLSQRTFIGGSRLYRLEQAKVKSRSIDNITCWSPISKLVEHFQSRDACQCKLSVDRVVYTVPITSVLQRREARPKLGSQWWQGISYMDFKLPYTGPSMINTEMPLPTLGLGTLNGGRRHVDIL
jgi:hypothetical protein